MNDSEFGPREDFLRRYGQWALIIGASEGIGEAFAEQLAELGLSLLLVARRGDVLDQVAAKIRGCNDVEVETLTADMALPEGSKAVLAACAGREIGLLIYNAGSDPAADPFLSQAVGHLAGMVHRNCTAVLELCHELGGAMVERGRGGVILLSSGGGFVGMPNVATYSSTKAFNINFAEALWAEWGVRGVEVIGLVIGATDTPALRRVMERHRLPLPQDMPSSEDIAAFGLASLLDGPTVMVDQVKDAWAVISSRTRREIMVEFMRRAPHPSPDLPGSS